jgi:hypothetical protein
MAQDGLPYRVQHLRLAHILKACREKCVPRGKDRHVAIFIECIRIFHDTVVMFRVFEPVFKHVIVTIVRFSSRIKDHSQYPDAPAVKPAVDALDGTRQQRPVALTQMKCPCGVRVRSSSFPHTHQPFPRG